MRAERAGGGQEYGVREPPKDERKGFSAKKTSLNFFHKLVSCSGQVLALKVVVCVGVSWKALEYRMVCRYYPSEPTTFLFVYGVVRYHVLKSCTRAADVPPLDEGLTSCFTWLSKMLFLACQKV